ncbi:MAG TPA: SBBP repeat-containing protein [Terriglobia bacterium]|nr:SBBP repeat-containing protein [Terriglobia bacterium]
MFLTASGAVLTLQCERKGTPMRAHVSSSQESVLRLIMIGGNPYARISGEKELPGKSNYFIGNNPRHWHTDVPTYAQVHYHGVYPGMDVIYYGRQGQLENDFIVAPGADPSAVRIRVQGAESVKLDPAGDLLLETKKGEVKLERPVAFQGNGKGKRQIGVRYALLGHNEVGLRVAGYQRDERLTIDPALLYSTYLGGNGGDIGYGIAVDVNDNIFVCGVTNSSNFPTSSAYQSSYSGTGDAFITELNAAETALVYSTYLGGSGTNSAAACALGTSDALFVTGSTTSTDFPIAPTVSSTSTTTAFQPTYGGNGDAFVAEIAEPGNQLTYSSYLGGSGADFGQGIAVDSLGNAYVTGSTQSSDFPTLNAEQPTIGGASDAFVTKVNFTGTSLVYSTYLGGSQADTGQAIKVDSSGNAYVTGYTYSTNFPTMNSIQTSNAGGSDAFITELSASTASAATPTLLFSTYLGGSGNDEGLGLALDKSGDIYVTGITQSGSSGPFPTTSGAYQTALKGTQNAFATKLAPGTTAGTFSESYSSYLGGSTTDQGNGIAVDSSGDAFVVGYTQSSDFPLVNPTQTTLGITGGSTCGTTTCADAFVTEMNPAGSQPLFSTFLGGSGADFGQGIALDSSDNAFVTGSTASTNFPTSIGDYQGALGGVAGNAFVGEIEQASAPGLTANPAKINFGNEVLSVKSTAQQIAVVNEGTAALSISSITVGNTTDFAETDNCIGTVAANGGSCTINVTFTPSATGSETSQLTLTDNANSSPQSIALSGSGVTTSSAITLSPTTLTFGPQAVGTVSAPQIVTITNSGTSTVDISSISVTGNFSETNTCLALKNVLAVGQSCSASVTFAPTGSGALSGSLSVNDTATGSPQTAALSATGSAVFSLSSSTPVVTTLVGNTSATFTVSATAQSGFTGSITLSCAGAADCSFSPSSIISGQSSTLTLGDLSVSTANPYNFTVQGSSGSQSTTLALRLDLEDYSLSGSPTLNTIEAGDSAAYTIVVTPVNGFNQALTFSCTGGLPAGGRCSFSPSTVTPNGSSPVALKLIVVTTTELSQGPFGPGNRLPPPWILVLAGAWLALAVGLWMKARRSQQEMQPAWKYSRCWVASRAVVLGGLLFAMFLFASCRGVGAGAPTPSGNYAITVTGYLQSNTTVYQNTVVDLAVTPTT